MERGSLANTQTGTLKDLVYRNIIAAICDGVLNPDTIFTEGQMMEKYGVSKAPVREALVQLCHENVLRSIPRCGYQVIQVSTKNVHDLIQLRILLEVGSLPAIMENLDADSLQTLRKMNKNRMRNAEQRDVWTAWQNNLEYHLQLNSIARNEEVTAALRNAMNACTRAYAQVYHWQKLRKTSSSPSHEHDLIITALEEGNLAMAQEALTKDLMDVEQLLLEHPSRH